MASHKKIEAPAETSRYEAHLGDCLDVLAKLPEASCDAMITDPPAGINFLRLKFDSDRGGRDSWIQWARDRFAASRRVLVPGAHAIVWALPRTSHWTATALEDAGFEICDIATHLQSQGMPKSRTLLKPAAEHWILARTPGPLRQLNIDRCRLRKRGGGGGVERDGEPSAERVYAETANGFSAKPGVRGGDARGRYPANITLEHHRQCRPDRCVERCAVRLLNEQSGMLKSGSMAAGTLRGNRDCYSGNFPGSATLHDIVGDTGGASRFFYCAKATGKKRAGHPTEKPIDLMAWLCHLITPPGGRVLDPFAGSFTTGVASMLYGYQFVGIEEHQPFFEEYLPRLTSAAEDGVTSLAPKLRKVSASPHGPVRQMALFPRRERSTVSLSDLLGDE